MSAKKIKDGVPLLIEAMKAMAEKEVLIGIPSDSPENHRQDGEPITNAHIGFIMEFGAPEANIPARPFLIPGVGAFGSEASKMMSQGARKAMKDPSFSVAILFEKVGIKAANAVKAYITDSGHFTPLAESTLANRRSRGFVGEKPLIESGSLLNSITYLVDKK